MKKMREIKKMTAMLLAVVLALTLMPVVTVYADGPFVMDPEYYIDENGAVQSTTYYNTEWNNTTHTREVTWPDSDSTWYVINGTVTCEERLVISGSVRIILHDDATLNAQKGITVEQGSSLYIYAGQSAELYALRGIQGTGKLMASAPDKCAGIGGTGVTTSGSGVSNGKAAGTVIINSGIVIATGGAASPGIGGGAGGDGAGPGNGGDGGNGGTVVVNGGMVTATGGNGASGIGGGNGGNGGETGNGGKGSAKGTITIKGGCVTANGGGEGIMGIGGGKGGSGVNAGAEVVGGDLIIGEGVQLYGDSSELAAIPTGDKKLSVGDYRRYMKTIGFATASLDYGSGHVSNPVDTDGGLADKIRDYLEAQGGMFKNVIIGTGNNGTAVGSISFDVAAVDTTGKNVNVGSIKGLLYTAFMVVLGAYDTSGDPDALSTLGDTMPIHNDQLFLGPALRSLQDCQGAGKASINDIWAGEAALDSRRINSNVFHALWADKIDSVSITVSRPYVGDQIGGSTVPTVTVGGDTYSIAIDDDMIPDPCWYANDLSTSLDATTVVAGTAYGAMVNLVPKLGYYFSTAAKDSVTITNGVYNAAESMHEYMPILCGSTRLNIYITDIVGMSTGGGSGSGSGSSGSSSSSGSSGSSSGTSDSSGSDSSSNSSDSSGSSSTTVTPTSEGGTKETSTVTNPDGSKTTNETTKDESGQVTERSTGTTTTKEVASDIPNTTATQTNTDTRTEKVDPETGRTTEIIKSSEVNTEVRDSSDTVVEKTRVETVTETTVSEDGTETVAKTTTTESVERADGFKQETVTTETADGTTRVDKDTTAVSGAKTQSTTTTKADGTSESATVKSNKSGEVKTITTESKADGKTTEKETYKPSSGTNLTITSAKTTDKNLTVPSKVEAPNGKSYTVTAIGDNAFKGHKNLKNVKIPKTIVKIGDGAFRDATGMKSVVIGRGSNIKKASKNLKGASKKDKDITIGKNAFRGAKNLKSVNINGNVSKVGKNAFKGVSRNATIKVSGVTGKKFKDMRSKIKKSGIDKSVKIKQVK